MAFTYDVKQDFKKGREPTCGMCGQKIKVKAKGVMRKGKRRFYHPGCFKMVKL